MFFGGGGGFPFEEFEEAGGFPGRRGGGPKKEVENSKMYEILGVAKDATFDQIKKAYRKLAIKKHPDKGGDPEEVSVTSKYYSLTTNFCYSSKKSHALTKSSLTKRKGMYMTSTVWTELRKELEALVAWMTSSPCSWAAKVELLRREKPVLNQQLEELSATYKTCTMETHSNCRLIDSEFAVLVMVLADLMLQLSKLVVHVRVEVCVRL